MLEHVRVEWHTYRISPGDHTTYRFAFCRYPEVSGDAFVLDDGIGNNASKEYIKFYIQLAGDTGIGVLRLAEVLHFPEWGTGIIGYLKGHGMKALDDYTICAVILALKVLWMDPEDLERAARFMMDTYKTLYGGE